MKKDKKFLNELEEHLGNINSKYKIDIISKYENIIREEKAKKRKITDILKELGNPKEIAETEKNNYLNKSPINKIKYKLNELFKKKNKENVDNKKEEKAKIKKAKKELKEKIKEETTEEKVPFKEKLKNKFSFLTKDISFKKKEKNKVEETFDEVKEELEEVVEEAKDSLADVSEIVTEKPIFESKKTRVKRIILRTLGVILTSLLLFIWLWISVVFLASLFAYLDGVKFIGLIIGLFGIDLLVLWIVVMINKLVFKKKNNLKVNLIIVISSVFLIALGIVLFVRQVYKIEKIEDVSIKYSMTNKISTYSLPSDEDQKFYVTFNSNYKTQYTINYDKTLGDNIKIEVKYFECYYDYYVKKTTNNVYVSLKLDNRDRLSVYIDDFKEGKIFDNDELSRYSVKISINPEHAERLVIQD